MNKKRTEKISLLLIPVLLAASGCSYDPNEGGPMQRDVYTKFEDCMADWGKTELCQQMAQEDTKQFAHSVGVTGGGTQVIYWGPGYYPEARSVYYNGQTYTPAANRSMSRPFRVTGTSSTAARMSPASPARSASSGSAARGGFGGSARSASVGSSGG